ncbi:MAG: tRNA (adenosine(37)-N6)-threonylcarbamoyltransferase complex transferase subunit TsaD, partial [Clostridia bacterium]|nr:tRNA (adenosine(37)-N6)-threonylcarbamoyltransferase complex transferase subunit TsaD [Clostridia bacterium]
AIKFPSPALLGDNLDFSFSGIKTSALNYINGARQRGEQISHADIAASYTDSIVKAISGKIVSAIEKTGVKALSLSGGVAANSHLRAAVERVCKDKKIKLVMPERSLCGDNGAMIALAGYYEFKRGNLSDTYLNACAYSPLD